MTAVENTPITNHTNNARIINRKGETQKFWFRSERFFHVANDWFFSTREQFDVGPFDSRPAAEHGLNLYIDFVENFGTDPEQAVTAIKKGDWGIDNYQ